MVHNESEVQQRLKYLASGTGLLSTGAVFSNIVSLIYGIIAARVIGSELLGIYYLGLSFIDILARVAFIGLPGGILRYIGLLYAKPDFQAIRKLIRQVLSIITITSIVVSIPLFLSANAIAINGFHQPKLMLVLRVLTISILINSLKLTFFYSLQALQQIKYRAYTEYFIAPVIRLMLLGTLLFIGWRLMAVVTASLVSEIVSLAASIYYLRRIFGKVSDVTVGISEKRDVSIGEVIRFSLPLFPGFFLRILSGRILIWLLGINWSAKAVGIYGVVLRIGELGNFIYSAMRSVFAPMISELHSSGRLKELEHFYKTTTRWSFSFTLPISLLMILMSQQILQLYGKEFLAGASSLILVCVDGIIASAVGSFDYMIIMSGHSMVELYGTVGTQAMIIISGFFAIPKYGVFGAAFSFTVSVIFATLIMLLVLYYILRIHPYECGYVKPVVASGTASLSFIGLTLITPVRYPYNLIICSIAFLLIYFGLLWSMGLTHEETELLRSFKRAFIWTEAIRR